MVRLQASRSVCVSAFTHMRGGGAERMSSLRVLVAKSFRSPTITAPPNTVDTSSSPPSPVLHIRSSTSASTALVGLETCTLPHSMPSDASRTHQHHWGPTSFPESSSFWRYGVTKESDNPQDCSCQLNYVHTNHWRSTWPEKSIRVEQVDKHTGEVTRWILLKHFSLRKRDEVRASLLCKSRQSRDVSDEEPRTVLNKSDCGICVMSIQDDEVARYVKSETLPMAGFQVHSWCLPEQSSTEVRDPLDR